MLRSLFTHLMFRQDEVLLLDMYAGVEHLGRATVDFVDAMLIVVGPTRRSLTAADQIEKMARDIGLNRTWLVGNRVRNDDDLAFLEGPFAAYAEPIEPGAGGEIEHLTLQAARSRFEREFILKALAAQQGNISRTADVLGVERSNLYRKMRALGIATRPLEREEEPVQ